MTFIFKTYPQKRRSQFHDYLFTKGKWEHRAQGCVTGHGCEGYMSVTLATLTLQGVAWLPAGRGNGQGAGFPGGAPPLRAALFTVSVVTSLLMSAHKDPVLKGALISSF